MDKSFPHEFECEWPLEDSGLASMPNYYYPGASSPRRQGRSSRQGASCASAGVAFYFRLWELWATG